MFDPGQHLRAAWRLVRFHPWFALALGGGIALASGFTGTTLTLARALTAPVVAGPSAPADLVAVYRRSPDGRYQSASVGDLGAVQAARGIVSAAGGASPGRARTVRAGESLFEARVSVVHGALFEALAMQPAEGRFFTGDETNRGGNPAPMVVSRAFRERAFGADARIGAVVTVDGVEHAIVGVTRDFDGFELGRRTEAWLPAGPDDDVSGEVTIVARLNRDRAIGDFRATLPELDVVPFAHVDPAYRERLKPIAFALILAGVMVLAAGGVGVGALLISRHAARLDEIGARAALGATPAGLMTQLAVESGLVATAGCLAGAVFGFWTLRLLLSAMSSEQAAILDVDMGLGRLMAMSGSFLLVWIPVCAACAHHISKAAPALLQRSAGSLLDNPIGLTLQRRLLVVQAALACALLIAVTLLTRGFDRVLTAGLGRSARRVAIVSLLSPAAYSDAVRATRFQREALARTNRLPGVIAAAWASTLPLVEGPRSELAASPGGPLVAYRTMLVSASYFRTMQLDVVAGRPFDSEDEIAYAPFVVVNGALADRVLPDGPAGGQLFDAEGRAHPVLGVVADDRYRQMEADAEPTVYRPLSTEYTPFLHLLVRGAVDASTLMPAILKTLDAVDSATVFRAESLEVHLAGALGRDRVAVVLVRSCGLLVTLLSVSGAYLLSESAAARRRREMAVRLALGSTRRSLVVAMIGRAIGPTVAGVGLGAVGAYAVTPALRSVLGGLVLSDALLFVEGAVVVVGLSLAATAIPALAAARSISPIAALR